jgi:hypothetical protein
MKTHKLLIFAIFSLLLTSCGTATFIQVYKTTPIDQVVLENNRLVYEDQNCKVSYYFWDEGGNIGFQIYNKTDKMIYLNLEESFFVLNGISYNYYKNRVYTNTTPSGSVTYNEEKVVCIPSNSAKNVKEYVINRSILRDCEIFKYPTTKKIKTKTYLLEESPLVFSNRISYTLGENGAVINFKNEFYVSEVTNYPEGQMYEMKRDEFCGQKGGFTVFFKDAAADKFYNKYIKVKEIWKH